MKAVRPARIAHDGFQAVSGTDSCCTPPEVPVSFCLFPINYGTLHCAVWHRCADRTDKRYSLPLACLLVYVDAWLPDWCYNEPPIGRPVPETYIRTACSCPQTASYCRLKHYAGLHQDIPDNGLRHRTNFPVLPMA